MCHMCLGRRQSPQINLEECGNCGKTPDCASRRLSSYAILEVMQIFCMARLPRSLAFLLTDRRPVMIIEIKIANYRSINAAQTLSFVAEKAPRHPDNLIPCRGFKLLKAVALFGANASGK